LSRRLIAFVTRSAASSAAMFLVVRAFAHGSLGMPWP
jgi:hypothetical protein